MDRLISLFKEASDDARGRPPDLPRDAQPGLANQPLYFVQLMEYLRQQKREAELAADADGETFEAEGDDHGGYARDIAGCDIDEEDADMLIDSCAPAHR